MTLPNGEPIFTLDGPGNRALPFLAYEASAGLGRIFRSVFDIDTLPPCGIKSISFYRSRHQGMTNAKLGRRG